MAAIAATVLYGIVPRNCDPPGFMGVTARLDDLADLGVTTLWLTPITGTTPGSFGYEVTDYFDVREEYGTKEDFRALVQAAHARGLRILIDFVPNHTSEAHPYFQDAAARGRASPYWDYYDRDEAGEPTHYFDWRHLPNLNYDNPEVCRYMLEAFRYWVRELDVDGFRLDAVWGVKARRPEWLTMLVAEIRRVKPDALLIAEASARDPFYAECGCDAAYDWTDALGHWAWEDVFTGDLPIGAAMIEVLTAAGRGYHPDALPLRFLNNNDTGPRFITTHGVGLYRVALAMLLTLPGLPCLFAGDEVGAEYEPYAADGAIDGTDRFSLRADVKRLIALRRRLPALHSRAWRPLTAEPSESCFAYVRTADDGSQPVIVLLNFSTADLEACIEGPREMPPGELVDRWSGERVGPSDASRIDVSVAGWSFRILAGQDG